MHAVVYRPEFIQALLLLGKACRIASNAAAGFHPPVLVGGAVVEFDTAGQFTSGDFDFVTSSDRAFVAALQQMGFVQDRRPGVLRRARRWLHPTLLIGVDRVSGSLFDGHTDRSKLRIVDVGDGEICMPPTEDMIAHRIGQWAAPNRLDRSMLEQAQVMHALADEMDVSYLEQRIRDETAGALSTRVLIEPSEG